MKIKRVKYFFFLSKEKVQNEFCHLFQDTDASPHIFLGIAAFFPMSFQVNNTDFHSRRKEGRWISPLLITVIFFFSYRKSIDNIQLHAKYINRW